MGKKRRQRLDVLLVERGLCPTMHKAQALIMAGRVLVDGTVVIKAGKEADAESVITVKEGSRYVGRGGLKLEGALDAFGIGVEGAAVMDVGASTGGFTDCLLKRGARRVYAVDVGRGLLDASLRVDPRVRLLEGRNIRHLDPGDVGEALDMAVIDVSFISLEKVLPRVRGFLKEGGVALALVKPQFEVGRGRVGKGGVVRDPGMHAEVIERIKDFARRAGYRAISQAESPILGAKGNREFWLYLVSAPHEPGEGREAGPG
jgi:23S rRNA (cytidine1920-2'-O)/16S rRNA (cytidine1409-2'-O)-methyltransferase